MTDGPADAQSRAVDAFMKKDRYVAALLAIILTRFPYRTVATLTASIVALYLKVP